MMFRSVENTAKFVTFERKAGKISRILGQQKILYTLISGTMFHLMLLKKEPLGLSFGLAQKSQPLLNSQRRH